MKKIIAILLLLSLCLSAFFGCKKENEDPNDGKVDEEGNEPENGDTDKNDGTTGDNEDYNDLTVDYLNDDLSLFVELDEKYYKNYTVINNLSVLVGHEVIQTLKKYKSSQPVEGDGVISVGDVVDIYYKGYYLKNGEAYYFKGGDNTGLESPHSLEIGSGGFIPGFEYNMIGLKPADFDEKNPMIIETFFPSNYQSAELAGRTAYFEVTVVKHVEYDAPKLDDTFVTETLKLTAESLEKYEGDTLADKYLAKVRDEYVKKNSFSIDNVKQTAFWFSVLDGAVIKQYPGKDLKLIYDDLMASFKQYYESSYYSYYYTLEEFGCLYFGLPAGSDYTREIDKMAKEEIKSELVFYHIMNQEGLKPTEEEYQTLFDKYLTDALASRDITAEDFDSEAAYKEAKEKFASEIISANGENYFKILIYSQIIYDTVLQYGKVEER